MAEEGSKTLRRQTVGAMCIAQILGMIGYSGVAALLPDFIDQWSLSHTQAGWLSGIFFVGYAASVLVIVSLTDYVAARSVYLVSMVITALSYGAFAACDTFGAALVFRLLAGVGLAGTYMPGLKALSDKAEGHYRSRVVALVYRSVHHRYCAVFHYHGRDCTEKRMVYSIRTERILCDCGERSCLVVHARL